MNIHDYRVVMPFKIGDDISIKGTTERYRVEDILHTFSECAGSNISIELELYDYATDKLKTVEYSGSNWVVIKDE